MKTTQEMIQEMNDHGYPVDIAHLRYLKGTDDLVLTYNNNRSKKKHGPKPAYEPTGGMTVVNIGILMEDFIAECSKKDHFNFKQGAFVAVARAYTKFLSLIPKEYKPKDELKEKLLQDLPFKSEESLKKTELYYVAGFDRKGNCLGFVSMNESPDDYDPMPLVNMPCFPDCYTMKKEDIKFFKTIDEAHKNRLLQDEKIIKVSMEDIRITTFEVLLG